MKTKLLVTAFTLLFSASAANAASEVFIDQIARNLDPVVTSQMVSISEVSDMATRATGVLKSIRNDVNPTSSSAALLVQTGDEHQASINQVGPGNLGVVMQSDLMNSAALVQTGSGNRASISQSGYRNFATVTQTGNNHAAFVAQQGRGNVAIISQR
jgi:minor curlin subunit